MKEFENLITLGRKMSQRTTFSSSVIRSERGALITLAGDVAYLTTERKSAIYKIKFGRDVGHGHFYTSEAPINSEMVELRDGRVVFTCKGKKGVKRIFVPAKMDISKPSENAFKKYYCNPKINVPLDIFDYLAENLLITKLRVKGGKLFLNQRSSDGSVEIENEVNLMAGFSKFKDETIEDSEAIYIFTAEFLALKGLLSNLRISIREGQPLSLAGSFPPNGELSGLIAYLRYER